MIYESTVTSKGTITLPASIRKKLGIVEGKKVRIQLRRGVISVKPESGWEEFFANMDALQLSGKLTKPAPSTSLAIETAAARGRRMGY
jgi:AbrB family looped-hinge helix DNA binding protein